jgi:nucleoside phosphorylase/GTPase SAR1 family protein
MSVLPLSADALDGVVDNNRVKVVLVGDAGAGKTQLRRRLSGSPPAVVMVPSIDVSTVAASAAGWSAVDESEARLSLNEGTHLLSLWDFGGLAECYTMHDLFLTRGAVYVLVINWTLGVEKARESAQRWMDAIRAHVDDALVLPVLPRAAESFSDLDEVAQEIEKLIGRAPVRVDSAVDFNYDVLKRELLSVVEMRLADTTTHGKVPLRWLRAHDELCRLRAEEKKQWLTRSEFRALMQSLYRVGAAAVSEEDVARTLEYLKQSGTVLTCGGGGRVSEYVFLEPELFLALVRPLINTSEQLARRREDAVASLTLIAEQRALIDAFGQFGATCVASRALLEHMWRAVKSPTGEIGFFVELLEWCGLMCELKKDEYFVPAASKATPRTGIALDWVASAEQIALVCADEKISALPPSLLPRIVASLFKGGAIDKPNKQRIITLSDVVLLLRDDAGTDLRRMRLQQSGNRIVLTLQRRAGDSDAWRVRAFSALNGAVESVLQLVFGSLKVKAGVLCAKCEAYRWEVICPKCFADLPSVDAWLPNNSAGPSAAKTFEELSAWIFNKLTVGLREAVLLAAGVGKGVANQVAHNGGMARFFAALGAQVRFEKDRINETPWQAFPVILDEIRAYKAANGLLTSSTSPGQKLAQLCGSSSFGAQTDFVRAALLADAATSAVWTQVPLFRAFLDGASESSDEARWLASMQFAARQQTSTSTSGAKESTSSAEESAMFARIVELLSGAAALDGDAAVLASAAPLLAVGREVPLSLYEAVKRVVDECVDNLAIKSLLPLLCVVVQMERRVDALDFVGEKAGEARDSVRACVRGAMYEHVVESYALLAGRDVTLERGLETALLYVGVARQLEFFGGVPAPGAGPAVATVELVIDDMLRGDDALRAKYASTPLHDFKRRLPRLLLTTPEFAATAAAKLDGVVGDKRVKVILVGDSGVGKTQIRRRLGGEAFEAEHKSTDTAEVTSINVTFLTIGELAWTSSDTPGSAASAAGGAMLMATDQAPMTVSAGAAPDEAAAESEVDRDAKSAASGSDAPDAPAPTNAAPSAPRPQAPSAKDQRISALADNSQRPTMRPSGVDFDVADERKILSMWDFGGQSEYFAVHDLFLTERAVFMLVIDWTKGVEAARERAQVWLDALRAHVEVPVVLPVLPRSIVDVLVEALMGPAPSDEKSSAYKLHVNLKDVREAADRELGAAESEQRRAFYAAKLQTRRNDVAAVLKRLVGPEMTLYVDEKEINNSPVLVDSASDFNYDVLKRNLLALAEARMAANGQVALRWLQLHDELNRMRGEKHQWIRRAEFDEQLRVLYGPTHVVTDKEAQDALEYSKCVGTVLTCGGGERVSKYVFLDPQLFLDVVRPLINTPEQLQKREAEALTNVKETTDRSALHKAFATYGVSCVASRALLEQLWCKVAAPDGEDKVGFFVELLEHCGLMCVLREQKGGQESRFFVPAASGALQQTSCEPIELENVAQIGFEWHRRSTGEAGALPPSLLPRVVANLYNRSRIDVPSGPCVLGPRSFAVLLLGDDGEQRMQLEQVGEYLAVSLEGGQGDDGDARQWRLVAYVAIYKALECVLRLVFKSLSLCACVKCTKCVAVAEQWKTKCTCVRHGKLQRIDRWLPDEGGDWSPRENWAVVSVGAQRVEPQRVEAERSAYSSESSACTREHADLKLALPKTAFVEQPDRAMLGVDLLVVVLSMVEFKAVLRQLAPLPGFVVVQRCMVGASQHHIGLFGVYASAIVQPPSERDVQPVVAEAIQFWRPKAAIKIGTAFALRTSEQQVGDVLVSESLVAYDLQRMSDATAANRSLLSRFVENETYTWEFTSSAADNYQSRVHRGLVLSGAVNIESATFAPELRKAFPQAIGGELTGVAVASACSSAKVDWIVVKGVREVAGAPASSRAEYAAAAAASLVKHALSEHKLGELRCTDRSKLVPATRVIYFSASPSTTPGKYVWPKLDWKAGFDELEAATNAIVDRRKALSFEFYDDGTMEKLVEVLEAEKKAPIILVIACHGEPKTGALQFCDRSDRTLAQVVDAKRLAVMFKKVLERLELVAYCSCHSTLLAPSIQSEVRVPNFVAFGADEVSVSCMTRYLVILLAKIATSSGAPAASVVLDAKQELVDRATIESNSALAKFANSIMRVDH